MIAGDRLFDVLHRNTILLKYNGHAPEEGAYGWLHAGTPVKLNHEVVIEQNSGIYGGAYKAMPGGGKRSGLASIGAFSYSQSALPDGVSIGRYCSISTGLRFIDSTHPTTLLTTSAINFRPRNKLFKGYLTQSLRDHAAGFVVAGEKTYPVIGHDVWIGTGVTLNMGLTIGTGSIIAANSTVTKDIPPYSIVGGNPAKIIRTRIDPETAEKLLASRWWEFDPRHLFEDVTAPLDALADRIAAGELPRFDVHAVRVADYLDPDPA